MCHTKMCNGCPFDFSEESEKVQKLGKFPSPRQVLNLKKKGFDWQCHSSEQICQGLVEAFVGDSEEASVNRKMYNIRKVDEFPEGKLKGTGIQFQNVPSTDSATSKKSKKH